MSKPFDVTLNTLIDDHVGDWVRFLADRCGVPIGPAISLDTDLSASLQPDRLFRIDGPSPAVVHLELESNSRLGIPRELNRYNAFVHHQTELPVHSVLVLLRPKANPSDVTGELLVAGADGREYLRFRYTVVRVWLEDETSLLNAGPGIAPLALLTNAAGRDLESAFDRYLTWLRSVGLPSNVERSLLGSTFILCGLRHDADRIESLYRNLSMTLEDSTTYQLILRRGEARGLAEGEARGLAEGQARGLAQGEALGQVREAQQLVLLLGTKRFGPPTPSVEAAVRSMNDRQHLERLATGVLDATGWEELLATP